MSAKHFLIVSFVKQHPTLSRNFAEAFIVWYSTKYCSDIIFKLPSTIDVTYLAIFLVQFSGVADEEGLVP
jgi:hypothetical protein